jgi:hypothetical protein
MAKIYEAIYAGHIIRFSFHHNETKRCFRTYLRPSESDDYDVRATESEIKRVQRLLPQDAKESYAEYRCLIGLTARELLKYDCCIFHSVSFLFQGQVFLLTGPSGVGKSTQYLNWQSEYPDEIMMISGDMPVLERRLDGSIWVHPTSWNGKENIGNKVSGPAAGIIILEQGKENRIERLIVRDAVLPVLEQFAVLPENEVQIRALGRIADQILRCIPVWKMVNTGDTDSTALLRAVLSKIIRTETLT